MCVLICLDHQEALSGLLFLLKDVAPNKSLVELTLTLPTTFGRFPAVILSNWSTANSMALSKQITEVKCSMYRRIYVF